MAAYTARYLQRWWESSDVAAVMVNITHLPGTLGTALRAAHALRPPLRAPISTHAVPRAYQRLPRALPAASMAGNAQATLAYAATTLPTHLPRARARTRRWRRTPALSGAVCIVA